MKSIFTTNKVTLWWSLCLFVLSNSHHPGNEMKYLTDTSRAQWPKLTADMLDGCMEPCDRQAWRKWWTKRIGKKIEKATAANINVAIITIIIIYLTFTISFVFQFYYLKLHYWSDFFTLKIERKLVGINVNVSNQKF